MYSHNNFMFVIDKYQCQIIWLFDKTIRTKDNKNANRGSNLVQQTCLINLKLCGTRWPPARTTERAQRGSRGLTLTQSAKMSAPADFPWVPASLGIWIPLKAALRSKRAAHPGAGLHPPSGREDV